MRAEVLQIFGEMQLAAVVREMCTKVCVMYRSFRGEGKRYLNANQNVYSTNDLLKLKNLGSNVRR